MSKTSGTPRTARRVSVMIATLCSAIALALTLGSGVSAQTQFNGGEPAAPSMANFGELVSSVRESGASGIVRLLLLEAERPCVASGSCRVIVVLDNAAGTPPGSAIPFVIPKNSEAGAVATLQSTADAFYALDQDATYGYRVREEIKWLTADGRYPLVIPPMTRVSGPEATTMLAGFERELADSVERPSFNLFIFLPFLAMALIPFGALRWGIATLRRRREIAVLPGIKGTTRGYGQISGVALLALAVMVLAIDSAASGLLSELAPAVAASSLLAGVAVLFAARR